MGQLVGAAVMAGVDRAVLVSNAGFPTLFAEMQKYLTPVDTVQQLDFELLNTFFE